MKVYVCTYVPLLLPRLQAAEGSYGKLIIKGKKLKVMWGKPQGAIPTPSLGSTTELTPVPGLPPAGRSPALNQ